MREHIVTMAEIFKAFSDANRLRIIKLLASNMVDTIRVSDLAKSLGITESATSQHIKVLKNIGLLIPNKVGNKVYYAINIDKMNEIKGSMDYMFNLAFKPCEKVVGKKEENTK